MENSDVLLMIHGDMETRPTPSHAGTVGRGCNARRAGGGLAARDPSEGRGGEEEGGGGRQPRVRQNAVRGRPHSSIRGLLRNHTYLLRSSGDDKAMAPPRVRVSAQA